MPKIEWKGRKFGEIEVIFYNFESVLAVRNNSIKREEDDYASMWIQLTHVGAEGSLDFFTKYYKPNAATKRFIESLPKGIKHISITTGKSSIVTLFQDSFLKKAYPEHNPFICSFICDDIFTKIRMIDKYIEALGIVADKVLMVCASQDDADMYVKTLGVQVISTEELMND